MIKTRDIPYAQLDSSEFVTNKSGGIKRMSSIICIMPSGKVNNCKVTLDEYAACLRLLCVVVTTIVHV